VRWFTSDQHFGHTNIIAYCDRPFNSVWHMRTELIAHWNACVGEGDQVYVLGDFTMGSMNDLGHLGAALNGEKFLVPGNHDECWRGKRNIKRAPYGYAGFTILDDAVDIDMEGGVVARMCHFPLSEPGAVTRSGEPYVDRFTHYRPTVAKGQWLLHGHVHNAWKVKDHQINVGVDVWDYYPVSETEILRIVNG